MKGDFSRITFDPLNHYSRVLSQQGRVTLDADPNEQAAIFLHNLRTLARDLIGPRGGPLDRLGFIVHVSAGRPASLSIGKGHYYVDGILCENDSVCDYAKQPDYTPSAGDPLIKQLQAPSGQTFWLYLDVWERHITYIEHDPIREAALNGPDTCTRSKVVWQVKAMNVVALIEELTKKKGFVDAITPQTNDTSKLSDKLENDIKLLKSPDQNACAAPLDALTPTSDTRMAARLDPRGLQINDPCIISPDAKYRGAENQLYRVEIHRGSDAGPPTFKWSRDNGSVATPWIRTEGNDLIVANVRGFAAGAWVELSNDTDELLGIPGTLVKLARVESDRLSVDPGSVSDVTALVCPTSRGSTKVRRWDQTENDDITLDAGAVPIVEVSAQDPHWIGLEDGVQVQFASGGEYLSGDYWLIPARVATGSIEWPRELNTDGSTKDWDPLPPHGVEHHHAPLGFLSWGNNEFKVSTCLCFIEPINSCTRAALIRPVRPIIAPRDAAKPARDAEPVPAAATPTTPKRRKPK
ncbi:MAG TPA: DUF6519 domain-containing protein [Burkholderiales bacterium]|nr:DUF6519 domain-containing protein [Burkholderiales bacterium]